MCVLFSDFEEFFEEVDYLLEEISDSFEEADESVGREDSGLAIGIRAEVRADDILEVLVEELGKGIIGVVQLGIAGVLQHVEQERPGVVRVVPEVVNCLGCLIYTDERLVDDIQRNAE